MSHTCEDCEETFETLTSLRLHDCPADHSKFERQQKKQNETFDARLRRLLREEDSAVKRRVSDDLTDPLERAVAGDHTAVHQALAQYERYLYEEWDDYEDGEYWGFHRVFFGPAVDGLDSAVVAEGWPYLLEILDAYWPENTFQFESYPDHEPFGGDETDEYEQFPHVSHVLTTVTGMQMVRTRRAKGVDAIPTDALEYQLRFHRHPGDESPWIDSMSYGWAIGHSDHPVEETITTLVDGEYEIWAGTAIEHAMHADQHATTDLIEALFERDLVSDPALILHALGSIERGYHPDSSSHWNWETIYPKFNNANFEWDPAVRKRLRTIVEDSGLVHQLPANWTFDDIVL